MSKKESSRVCDVCGRAFNVGLRRPQATPLWRHKEFKKKHLVWGRRDFTDQFPADTQKVMAGVFLMLVHNDSSHPVHDRNGDGNVVLPAHSSALRPGRFENGIIGAQGTMYSHGHRRSPAPGQSGIHPELLQKLLVLDLSNTTPSWTRETLASFKRCLKLRACELFDRRDLWHPNQPNRQMDPLWMRRDATVSDAQIMDLMIAALDAHT